MTGFGSAESQYDQWLLRAEARSVNHRELQFSFRLPEMFQIKEHELQKLFEKTIHRGHVYFSLTCRCGSGNPVVAVDEGVVEQYVRSLQSLAESVDVPFSVDLAAVLRLPGSLRDLASDEEHKETLWPRVVSTAQACIDALVEMRRAEGANLGEQLRDLCASIEELTTAIEQVRETFVAAYHERLKERVSRLLDGSDVPIKEESLAREVALYADRCDVSEEIARLRSHIQQFRRTLDAEGEPVGRRMEFLGQEMLREAGTIAAKAPAGSHAEHVLELRSVIDRVREQVRNVE